MGIVLDPPEWSLPLNVLTLSLRTLMSALVICELALEGTDQTWLCSVVIFGSSSTKNKRHSKSEKQANLTQFLRHI